MCQAFARSLQHKNQMPCLHHPTCLGAKSLQGRARGCQLAAVGAGVGGKLGIGTLRMVVRVAQRIDAARVHGALGLEPEVKKGEGNGKLKVNKECEWGC